MLLGALVDSGVPLPVISEAIVKTGVQVQLDEDLTTRGSLRAARIHVRSTGDEQPPRRLSDVLALLAPLPEPVRGRASSVFERLAAAESAVHGIARRDVHFHEVGAVDAIADIVGVVAGLAELDLEALHASAVGVGTGRADTAHGSLPVPAPAVTELARGLPVLAGPAEFEAATPTGMALLAELVDTWGELPAMTACEVGVGAGEHNPSTHPNVVRLLLGDRFGGADAVQEDLGSSEVRKTWQLEANVDDMDPRLWPAAIDAVLAAGAVDAWLTPTVMKKGRPALTISALMPEAARSAVERAVLTHSTSIGLRMWPATQRMLQRRAEHVVVDGHRISVKIAYLDDIEINRSVEWDDVLAAAEALGRSPKSVLAQADALAHPSAAAGDDVGTSGGWVRSR